MKYGRGPLLKIPFGFPPPAAAAAAAADDDDDDDDDDERDEGWGGGGFLLSLSPAVNNDCQEHNSSLKSTQQDFSCCCWAGVEDNTRAFLALDIFLLGVPLPGFLLDILTRYRLQICEEIFNIIHKRTLRRDESVLKYFLAV